VRNVPKAFSLIKTPENAQRLNWNHFSLSTSKESQKIVLNTSIQMTRKTTANTSEAALPSESSQKLESVNNAQNINIRI